MGGMPATFWSGMFCLPVGYPKTQILEYSELLFCMLFGFMITFPRENVSSWIMFPWKTKKKLDYNIKIQECYVTHATRFLTFSTSTNICTQ
jgi:hypothetical protein